MQQIIDHIKPGGMLSDVIEKELGVRQHQQVFNLRQNKLGQWETVRGFKKITNQFTQKADSFIEVATDEARFLLLSIDNNIYRLDWNNGDYFGSPQHIDFPSSVSAVGKLRFSVTGEQIRIAGASQPLIYQHIKRTIFKYAAVASNGSEYPPLELDSWEIDTTALDKTQSELGLNISFHIYGQKQVSDIRRVKIAVSPLYDNGQYGDLIVSPGNLTKTAGFYIDFEILMPDHDNLQNNRLVGFAVLVSEEDPANVSKYEPYKIAEIISFKTQPIVNYQPSNMMIDSSDHRRFFFDRSDSKHQTVQSRDYAWAVGDMVRIGSVDANGDYHEIYSKVIDFDESDPNKLWIKILDGDLTTLANGTCSVGGTNYDCIQNAFVVIEKKYRRTTNPNKYTLRMAYNFTDGVTNFYTDSGRSPEGNHYPNYKEHIVIGNRAFVLPIDAPDYIRYSPIGQWDVFPPDYYFSTETGDKDENIRLVGLNNRFLILKKRTTSYGSYIGNSFTEHVGFVSKGLYSQEGIIIIDNVAIWLDKDDAYQFDGTSIKSVFKDEKLRNYYADHVNENSFIAYNKLDNEILFVLDTVIIVLHFETGECYLRHTSADVIAATNDFDNRCLFSDSNSKTIITFNHSESQFDEDISFGFITRIFDNQRPQSHKKLDYIGLDLQSNAPINVTLKGENQKNLRFTENMQALGEYHKYPNLLYKSLELQFESDAKNDLYAKINGIMLKVALWK